MEVHSKKLLPEQKEKERELVDGSILMEKEDIGYFLHCSLVIRMVVLPYKKRSSDPMSTIKN